MTFEEAVAYYHTFDRFGVMPGLERIGALCARLGNPQDKLKYIHVAGTNGKGSVCTLLSSVFTAAGYRTGCYTSPYVTEFRERICLDGEMIPEADLIEVTGRVKKETDALASEGIVITEFEAVTAAAFLWYSVKKCDIVILETGLGGRYDATNIIKDPIACVITSISLDHTRVLGPTTGAIAGEKAGIIKEFSPVIIPPTLPADAKEVILKEAVLKHSPVTVTSPGEVPVVRESLGKSEIEYRGERFILPFTGRHFVSNAALVLSAVDKAADSGYNLPVEAVKLGFSRAFVPARIEMISREPLVILDGCHNDDSTRALSAAVEKHLPAAKILAVMGMMADKDVSRSLSNLLPRFSKLITVKPSNPRSMPAEELKDLAVSLGADAVVGGSPQQGLELAKSLLPGYDALVICGSLYLASDIRNQAIRLFN